ncbi:MAG: hypothetical protein AAFV62_05900 [Pseudomonadota bacterium]
MDLTLHIGGEKTGTTTLQSFLYANRKALERRGLFRIDAVGQPDSRLLATLAMRDDRCDESHARLRLLDVNARRAMTEKTARAIARTASRLPAGARIVVSSEHLQSRLWHQDEVSAVKDMLTPFAGRIRVVCYLRRQVDLAVSFYATQLRAGVPASGPLPHDPLSRNFYRYDQVLERWANVFGDAAMDVRIFEPEALVGDDIVTDFLSKLGVDDLRGLSRPPVQNRNLSPAAVQFLERVVPAFPRRIDGAPNPDRGRLHLLLAERFPGRGLMPSQAAARAFQAQFEEINETIRARWLPDRAQLFSEDFSTYPETEAEPLSLDETIEIATAMWAEIEYLSAEIARRDGKTTRALWKARNALALAPGHAGATHLTTRLEKYRGAAGPLLSRLGKALRR